MATKLYFRDASPNVHRGSPSADLIGSATSRWNVKALSITAGASVVSATRGTVAGPTAGLEVLQGSTTAIEWISDPLDQAVTISGTITFNLWMSETNMSDNAGAQVVIERLDSTGAVVSTVVNSERGVELALTTRAVNNWTLAATSTNMLKGDRFRIRVAINDVGTMAGGGSASFGWDGGTGGADGDSFVSFTETFGFLTTTPAGSTLYPTDTASDVSAGTTEREMWTARGAGVQNDVTNTAAGPTAGIQTTDTAGGAAVEWYTKQLQAFTLAGPVTVNVRALTSSTASQASPRVEVSVCNADGTGAVVWASAAILDTGLGGGRLTTSETDRPTTLCGADVAVTAGQRLRFRIYVDESALSTLVTGQTVTTFYAGTSGGASGDSYVTLSQTVAEFANTPSDPPKIPHRFHNGLIMRGRR